MDTMAEKFAAKLHELAAKYGGDFGQTAAAVSGGADSLALAFLLKEFHRKYGGRTVVLTVNHHLRPEADAEVAMVAELMAQWGLEHHVLDWFPGDIRSGVEEKARVARYHLLENWCAENGFRYLLTAHHMRDQAETFLMRLQRGSGVDGLSAMAEMTPRGQIMLVRPLLETDPLVLRQLLKENGIVWAEDALNDCDDFLRVRIRKFLPELEAKTGIGMKRLAEAAYALRLTREYLDAETNTFIDRHVRCFDGLAVSLSPAAFCRLHPEIGRRVLARLIKEIGERDYPPEYRELQRLNGNLQNPAFAGCTLGGCEILPFMKRWWIVREGGRQQRITRKEWGDFVCRCPRYRQAVIPYPLKCLLTEKGINS